VRVAKASGSEPLMTCRNSLDDIETGVEKLLRDEPGGSLPTGQVVSGMKVARARLRLLWGTWEPVASARRLVGLAVSREREIPKQQACKGLRTDAGTGADRLVVATMPGNAGGAKGAGHLGSLGGQPAPVWLGGAR
jgi:hypothetical protein